MSASTENVVSFPSMIAQAMHDYGQLGIPTYPLDTTDKKARISGWQDKATTEAEQHRRWVKKHARMRIATVAGAKSGLINLDLDVKEGKGGPVELAKLEAIHGALPPTLTATTPSGGKHIFFKMPCGVNLYNRAGDIAPGIDTRASRADGSRGGVIPLWPSPGPHGGCYEFQQSVDCWRFLWGSDLRDLPEPPPWLLFHWIFNRRQREGLAALDVTGPESFGGTPASEWEKIGREKLRRSLRATHGAPAEGPLPSDIENHLRNYIEDGISGELASIRGAEAGRRDQQINDAALKIWSLLHGADEWFDAADIADKTRERFLEAANELGTDEKAGPFVDIAAEKWNRCCDDAEARDLSHVVAGRSTVQDDFGDLPGEAPKFDPFGKVFGKSAARWIGVDPLPSRFVVDKIVPEGFVTLLAAAGGRGKSLLSLQAMVCVASGAQFLGYDVAQGKAAAIFCEDEPEELHRRTKAICTRLGVNFEAVADRLWPSSRVGMDVVLWTDKGAVQRKVNSIREAVASQPDLKLLILDGVAFLFAAPEQDRSHVTRFIASLTSIAQAHSIAVLLIHHESKTSGDDDIRAASGSTAWINACRSVLKLNLVDGQINRRTLQHIKSNRGARQLPVTCVIDGSGFHSLSGDRERQKEVINTLTQLMREAAEAGVNLTPSAKSASRYAPKWLHKNQHSTDFTADEFKQAIDNLMGFEFIKIERYENKGGTHERYTLCDFAM